MLDFSNCNLCGECCKRKNDYIPLTIFDLIRVNNISKDNANINNSIFKLHMIHVGSIGDISLKPNNNYKYTINVDGWIPLPYMELPCKFLINNKCVIHSNKPLICISFPYHLPIWKENDSCNLIRILNKNKEEGKLKIPKKSKNAIKLYQVALSATMYQLNLPIYSFDKTKNNLILNNSFKDLVDKSKNHPNIATKNQISSWVKNHTTRFNLMNKKYNNIKIQLRDTLSKISQNDDLQESYFLIMNHLAKYHFVTKNEVDKLIQYFL